MATAKKAFFVVRWKINKNDLNEEWCFCPFDVLDISGYDACVLIRFFCDI